MRRRLDRQWYYKADEVVASHDPYTEGPEEETCDAPGESAGSVGRADRSRSVGHRVSRSRGRNRGARSDSESSRRRHHAHSPSADYARKDSESGDDEPIAAVNESDAAKDEDGAEAAYSDGAAVAEVAGSEAAHSDGAAVAEESVHSDAPRTRTAEVRLRAARPSVLKPMPKSRVRPRAPSQSRARSRSARRTAVAARIRPKVRPKGSITQVKREEGVDDVEVAVEVDLGVCNSCARSTPTPPPPLPSSVGQGNFFIASWVVSDDADCGEMLRRLERAVFDCVIVVFTHEGTNAWHTLSELARFDYDVPAADDPEDKGGYTAPAAVAEAKLVHKLTPRIFAVTHKHKVRDVNYAGHKIYLQRDFCDMPFGRLELFLDTTRQRMKQINIGIVDARAIIDTCDVLKFSQWIIDKEIAVLTGAFHNLIPHLHQLAINAGAVGGGPLYQPLTFWNDKSCTYKTAVYPAFFVLFGYFRQLNLPDEITDMDWALSEHGIELGKDIYDACLWAHDVPWWKTNHVGSAAVPNLGNVKMKEADFKKWFSGVLQTVVWLGTATPSYDSQTNHSCGSQARRSGGSHKGFHKGKKKGKGTGGKGRTVAKDYERRRWDKARSWNNVQSEDPGILLTSPTGNVWWEPPQEESGHVKGQWLDY